MNHESHIRKTLRSVRLQALTPEERRDELIEAERRAARRHGETPPSEPHSSASHSPEQPSPGPPAGTA